jgi:hypothetical protein
MENVTALMVTGMANAQPELAPELGEFQFRVAAIAWAIVAVGAYLAWSLLADWFALHPIGTYVLIGLAVVSVGAPLLLLVVPYLREPNRPATTEGGSALC